MRFDDLLAQNPALRRLRSLDADTLRSLFGRLRGECTWCGNPVQKGRRTWCSDQCVDAFSHRCCANKSVAYIRKRDGNICRICGVNVKEQENEFERQWREVRKTIAGYGFKELNAVRDKLLGQFCYGRGRWHEVDHEVPVSEGGGLCDPELLRLLCGKCHASVTADLQARLSSKRTGKAVPR